MKFMEILSACVSENVDLDKIMQGRMDFVKQKATTLNCTPNLRAKLQQRRPAFEMMIQHGNETRTSKALRAEMMALIRERRETLDAL